MNAALAWWGRVTQPTLESIRSALPKIFDEVQSTFG